jgi:hypothetical protein
MPDSPKFLLGILIGIFAIFGLSTATPVRSQADLEVKTYLPLIIDLRPAPIITQYTSRSEWQNAMRGNVAIEDFENEKPSYAEIHLPFTSANGFVFSGQSIVQIIRDPRIMDTGVLMHFCDWKVGMTVAFPDGAAAKGFGFNYHTFDDWYLSVNAVPIVLSSYGTNFIGIVIENTTISSFTLYTTSYVQGGLTLDNISYGK